MAQEQKPITILGGGQLALYLAQAAKSLGMGVHVWVQKADEPAVKFADAVFTGDGELSSCLSQAGRVIFENEFLDCAKLQSAAGKETQFLPGLDVIRVLQNKLSQKKRFRELAIPTSPFQEWTEAENAASWCESVHLKMGEKFVLKWANQGYDGKGVFVKTRANTREAVDFMEEARKRKLGVFAEEWVGFVRELAMVACRSEKGEFMAYPLVISKQWEGICQWVWGPAEALGVSSKLEKRAREICQAWAHGNNLVGCFGVEFFETEKSELWVNETAPRVHNTGHYSMDACPAGQFENHVRATMGLSLGAGIAAKRFIMRNLLGPSGVKTPSMGVPLPAQRGNLFVHWYGKSELRDRRKQGHVNYLLGENESFETATEKLEAVVQDWEKEVQKWAKQKKR